MSMAFVRCNWMFFGDNSECGAVVSLDGSLGLLVAHLFEELAHRYGFAGIDIVHLAQPQLRWT